MRETAQEKQVIVLTAEPPRPRTMPTTILGVLEEWGCTWMWNSLRLIGDDHWLEDTIEAGTCVAVIDGSYIRELIPNVCSATFILGCSERRGQMVGSFLEQPNNVNAYRAELLGLMAIHQISLDANRVKSDLTGAVSVVSDCLGALGKVSTLPENWIPSRCRYLDILKNIMVNCNRLGFNLQYLPIRVNQDELLAYHLLSRLAQLNCLMEIGAKQVI